MPKNRYFSIGRKSVNVQELGKQIVQNAQDIFETQISNEVSNIVSELSDLIVAIGEGSSFRGRGVNAGQYNYPITQANAPIIVKSRRDKNGDLSYTIRVDNEKFNILDQGSPARSKRNGMMRFPRYKGTLTKPNSLDIADSPVKILDVRTKSQSKVVDPNDLDAFFGTKDIEGWVTTSDVDEIKPRNFLINIAKKVRQRRRGFIKTRVRRREV